VRPLLHVDSKELFVTRAFKTVPLLVVFACAAFLATSCGGSGSAAPATAAKTNAAKTHASTPCWKLLINDWYDGRIDKIYKVSCYREALNHVPGDLNDYSSLRDDINRALQAAVLGHKAPPNQGGPKGPVSNVFKSVGPKSADSVPMPIIVLAAIAGFLLLIGGAGFIARKMQTRRTPMRPAESGSSSQNP
jgi:hypothetical protein